MRLMLAAPDRGLLAAYRGILEQDIGETVTAFDGTQVIRLIGKESFDLVILDRALPRVDTNDLMRMLQGKSIPVIALWDEPVTASLLTAEPLASSYLSYPFVPRELTERIRSVLAKKASAERFGIPSLDGAVSDFSFPGGTKLTAEEIDTLLALRNGDNDLTADGSGVYFSALNRKFVNENLNLRIEFKPDSGFRLVVDSE